MTFERSRDKRAIMLRDLLAAAGAQEIGRGGPFPVPPLPPAFSYERPRACAAAFVALQRAVLQDHAEGDGPTASPLPSALTSGKRCVIIGGHGGQAASTFGVANILLKTSCHLQALERRPWLQP